MIISNEKNVIKDNVEEKIHYRLSHMLALKYTSVQ